MFVERLGLGFIHIPKTAGNAIQEQLLPFSAWKKTTNRHNQDGVERFGLVGSGGSLSKHSTLSEHSMSAQGRQQPWLYFTVVRDPIDRFVSYCAWHYATLGKNISTKSLSKILMNHKTIADFLDMPCDLIMHSRAASFIKERSNGFDGGGLTVIALPFETLEAALASFLSASECGKGRIPNIKVRNKSEEQIKTKVRRLVEHSLLLDSTETLKAEMDQYQTLMERGRVGLHY